MKITVSGNSRLADALIGKIREAGKGIEVLGPVISKNKKGEDESIVIDVDPA
jgi:hypothetical protein